MTSTEKLLTNLLDSLDRLFDRDCRVIDVWALAFATSEALRETEHYAILQKVLPELLATSRSLASADEKRDRALIATDSLRHYLAVLLPS
jgi:hypothetical protein